MPVKNTSEPNVAVIISALTKDANPIIRKLKSIEVKSNDQFEAAVTLLKSLKELGKKADEKQNEIVSPIRKSLGHIYNLFKPFKTLVEEMDTEIKLKCSVYIESQQAKKIDLTKRMEDGNMSVSSYVKKSNDLTVQSEVASFRKKPLVVITSKSKIPLKYLVPDEKLILKDLQAGKKIPGCKLHISINLAI
jgi:hypothetical protein